MSDRSTPQATDTSRDHRDRGPEAVRVRLLGGFSVSVGSRTVRRDEWRSKKAANLVKLLALAPGHRMHREHAIDLLWPDSGKKAASNNLRQVVYGARMVFHPGPGSRESYLGLKDEQLVLCPEGQLWVDADAFEEAASTARRSREPAAYRAVLDLYSGELLPEDRYEEWAEGRREQLRQLYLALLIELAGLYEGREEHAPAIEALMNATAEEPTLEEAHVAIMRLHAFSGRPERALAQYERLRDALQKGIGTQPAEATRRLRDEIATERLPMAPPADPARGEPSAAARHNLPAPMTSFVGRESETVEIKRALSMTRLLTLTGAGGSGKTRLALEMVRALVDAYPDGVWLVELASLSQRGLMAQEVANVLGVQERPGELLADTIAEVLAAKEMLLVIDNCEHLVEEAARLVYDLLASCPRLRVLATIREPLAIPGEVNWAVPPLSLPKTTNGRLNIEALVRYEAIRLFLDRARLRLPDFGLTKENAGAVARACRKLEGIPLAIELATARMGSLAVEQVAQRLEISLDVLKDTSRSAAPRQQTLRATLDWSHDLLSKDERVFFSRLSVFAGGWTLEAAEAVCSGDDIEREDVLGLLGGLVDKSLVVAVAATGGAARYRMLEPVRQYAREKLEEAGEPQEIHRRHAAYFLTLAEVAEEEGSGPNHTSWLDRLETEHDNLRIALDWSLEGYDTELGLRLAGALGWFWYSHGYLSEGRRRLESAISRSDSRNRYAPRAKVLKRAGWLALFQDDHKTARVHLEESLALYRELRDEEGTASSLTYLGFVAVLGEQEDVPVLALLDEAVGLKQKLKDRRTVGDLLVLEGLIAASQGDLKRGAALHEEGLVLFREMRDSNGMVMCLNNLGLIALAQTDYERASTALREGLDLARELNHKVIIQYSFYGLAAVATARERPVRAARLWGAAEAMNEAYGMHLTPVTRSRTNYEGYLAAARSQLDEARFLKAWEEGKAMTAKGAVEYALSAEEPDPSANPILPTSPPDEPTGDLTRREREVAALVARGLTNRQIARELSISERTSANHVAKILKKLGLSSRTQIASWMAERQPSALERK